MTEFFTHEDYVTIADALVDKGYICLEITTPLLKQLSQHIQNSPNLSSAFIGRDGSKQQDTRIRSDKTLWLDERHTMDTLYLNEMQGLQEYLNRSLFMGLKYHEAHYAHYEKGSFYHKHIDAFKGRSSRKLTTVLYLNETWSEEEGGELTLYDKEGRFLENFYPYLGRMLIFLSDVFPHEVKVSGKDRFSIAGWFRID